MKTLVMITLIMAFIGSVIAAPVNTSAIKKYRSQYNKLVVKWQKTDDKAKREALEKQIEELKAKNLHLFKH